jgi:hypothetical protein
MTSSNGTPLLYVLRSNFAEHPVLEKAIIEWGHGYALTYDDYASFKWEQIMQKIVKTKRPDRIEPVGGIQCAREIENLITLHKR